jgi:hypothetical protein
MTTTDKHRLVAVGRCPECGLQLSECDKPRRREMPCDDESSLPAREDDGS